MNTHTHSLREYLQEEVLYGQPFSWRRVYKRVSRSREANFLFWFRIAYVLHRGGNRLGRSLARRINRKIRFKYCCDLNRKSEIGIGFKIGHLTGIVVHPGVTIGRNVEVRQNTTIGTVDDSQITNIVIGDNVDIGANCCIVGNAISIGNNVTIGAMSFVNKSIADNQVYITPKIPVSHKK